MKKTIKMTNVKSSYKIQEVVGHLGLFKTEEGFTGIVDLDENRSFLEPNDYAITFDKGKRLIFVISKDRMTIYDAWKKKAIIRDGAVATIYIPNELIAFWTPNGSKRLFDAREYIKTGSTAKTEYEKIELLSKSGDVVDLAVERQGKISSYNSDMFENVDDIEDKYGFLIVTQNGKKHLLKGDYRSPDCDEIEVDENNHSIVYYKEDGMISAYALFHYPNDHIVPIMLTKIEAEKLEFVDKSEWPKDHRGTYRFKSHKKGGTTLISTYVGGTSDFHPYETVLPDEDLFDEVTVRETDILLKRNGKLGIFKNDTYIEPVYESVDTYPNGLYIFHKQASSTIIYIHREAVTVAEDVQILEIENQNVVFSKDGEISIYSHTPFSHNPVTGYKSYRKIYKGFYELCTPDDTYELYNNGSIILKSIAPISSHIGTNYKGEFDERHIYLVYSPSKGTYELANYQIDYQKPAELDYALFDEYTDIKFMSDMIYFETEGGVVLTNYNTVTLDYLLKGTTVLEHPVSSTDEIHTPVYEIDGIDYVNRDCRLIPVDATKTSLCIAAYECDYGTVVVNTDEDNFQKECDKIDHLPEESVENTLKTYYETHPAVQEVYPKLVYTPQKK